MDYSHTLAIAQRLGGKVLGEGDFAVVVEVDATSMPFRTAFATKTLPQGRVALKIMTWDQDLMTFNNFMKHSRTEYKLQKKLYDQRCQKVGSETFCTRDYVPRVYFGGYDTRMKAFFICMEIVKGTQVSKMVNTRTLPLWAFREYERGILALLLAGVVHNDLHVDNVFVDAVRKKVTFIDFGGSTFLKDVYKNPADLRRYYTELKTFITSIWPHQSLVNRFVQNNAALLFHPLLSRNVQMKHKEGKLNQRLMAGQRQIRALEEKLEKSNVWRKGYVPQFSNFMSGLSQNNITRVRKNRV